MAEARNLRDLVGAIADGTPIEWGALEATVRNPGERDFLHRLKSIATAAERRRPPAADDTVPVSRRPRVLFAAMVAAAAIKTALAFAAGCALLVLGTVPPAAVWPPVVSLAVFGAGGGALMLGGARDLRARQLGMFFLVTASAFSDRLLTWLGAAQPPLAPWLAILARLPTDAFLALALWLFVWEFPSPPRRRSDRRFVRRLVQAAAAVGVILFAAGAAPLLTSWGIPVPFAAEAAAAFDRHAPSTSAYWPVLFAVMAPALPYAVWKARLGPAEERRRAATFAMSFAAGLGPMVLAVIVSPYMTFFDDPANRETVGLFLYAALLSVVPATAYAVVVDRVMDVELLITAAMRHRAIRYGVWLAGIAPLCVMAAYTYAYRHLTVTEIFSAREALVLLPLGGVTALMFRHQIFRAIDRQFVGERPDYLQALAYLERALRETQGVRDVIQILAREVERAVHVTRAEVLVLDESGGALISTTSAVRALPLDSTLGSLVRLTRAEIYAGVEASGPVRHLLPVEDRQWLTDHGVHLLIPLAASGGDLLGVLALGAKRAGADFSAEDRLLLSMMVTQGAMTLENRSLRDLPWRYLIHPTGRTWSHVDWDDEPCALCPQCRLAWPARRVTCTCGSSTAPGALPLLLRGKFRVERLIGSGGMSVVYLATDIPLNRRVAIKTLPSLLPDRVARLEREARAMASVLHPNLALIFSIENWRGAPVLVVEYLEGGTLADWLAVERLHVPAVIDLGIVIADVLDQMHASDVLHRDIKPSNIGYARDGSPKLMDFGVAHVLALHAVGPPPGSAATAAAPAGGTDRLLRTSPDHTIGTPLYLSPEAVAGAEPDCSFDLWSLSLTLYEALSGHRPFQGDTVAEVFEKIARGRVPDIRSFAPECPDDLAGFFDDALARDPERRPATAADLRNRLSRIRADHQRR